MGSFTPASTSYRTFSHEWAFRPWLFRIVPFATALRRRGRHLPRSIYRGVHSSAAQQHRQLVARVEREPAYGVPDVSSVKATAIPGSAPSAHILGTNADVTMTSLSQHRLQIDDDRHRSISVCYPECRQHLRIAARLFFGAGNRCRDRMSSRRRSNSPDRPRVERDAYPTVCKSRFTMPAIKVIPRWRGPCWTS